MFLLSLSSGNEWSCVEATQLGLGAVKKEKYRRNVAGMETKIVVFVAFLV